MIKISYSFEINFDVEIVLFLINNYTEKNIGVAPLVLH